MDKNIKERWEAIDQGLVPKGYKKTKVGIIPEDWDVKKLGEVADVISGGTPSTSIPEYWADDVLWATPGDITSTGKYIYDTSRKISNLGLEKSSARLLPENSILMTSRATVGECSINKLPMATNQGFKSFVCHGINYEYLYYNMEKLKKVFKSKASGSTFLEISKKDVDNTKIKLPSLEEQEGIADILSTWDRSIESYGKLLEEKKERKKGLMQVLLTGEKRLGGFTGPWKEVRLGEIGETYNGLTGKNKNDFGTGEKFITYKNIFDNSRVDIDNYGLVEIEKNEKQNVIKYGDIIFTTSSETSHEVGMSSVVLEDINENIYLNSFCFGFRLKKENTLYPIFSRYYFRGNKFREDIFKLAQGSTRFNLSKNELMKIKIRIPSLEEQKAIAEVLSTADEEIDLLEKLIEELKEEKKGLMQLLLKGIVRV